MGERDKSRDFIRGALGGRCGLAVVAASLQGCYWVLQELGGAEHMRRTSLDWTDLRPASSSEKLHQDRNARQATLGPANMSQEKISVYNLADLKNTSDDAIPNYLNSLRFTQSHRLTDVRLALGYSALAVAVACFMWDRQLGFDSTKYYSAGAVIVYLVLNGALVLWSRNVEGATVYVGTSPSDETVSIATSVEKYTPIYNVEITVSSSKAGTKAQKIALSRPFSEWFDGAGTFVAAPFQSMFATAVPAIGHADPKRAASATATVQPASTAAPETTYTSAMLDILASASAAEGSYTSGTEKPGAATGSVGKKGGKRRKV
ncbi:hypothetical protein SEPCBS119000_001381 [Sporothrix epigloea]|uniref:Signal peptidase complex subunit 2 n=1 Tax=Sporothrix epigloea TaxID=1892477 RepID=A0ABP0DC13_9PEZI